MLKLYFYTQFVINLTCFDLSWSSSGIYWTTVRHIYKHGWIIKYISGFGDFYYIDYLNIIRLKIVPTICTVYLLIYSLTQWSRVLLEKLIVSELVKKFPAFYGTWRFITAFTNACHLSLSLGRTKVSAQVRGFLCEHFVTWYVFTVRSC